MKSLIRPLSLVATLALTATTIAGADPVAFSFDRAHSEVGFNIRHIFNKTHGRFNDYTGTLSYDPVNVAASTVEVAIVDSSIFTGNERRDSDLRSPNFFDVAKYPVITFKSTKVVPGKDASHFQVVGDFSMHGVTKPVTLDVESLGLGPVAVGGHSLGTQAGFAATTTIKRQDWGITWNKTLDQGGVMLGDDVEIVLSIAATTPQAPRPAPPAAAATDKK